MAEWKASQWAVLRACRRAAHWEQKKAGDLAFLKVARRAGERADRKDDLMAALKVFQRVAHLVVHWVEWWGHQKAAW